MVVKEGVERWVLWGEVSLGGSSVGTTCWLARPALQQLETDRERDADRVRERLGVDWSTWELKGQHRSLQAKIKLWFWSYFVVYVTLFVLIHVITLITRIHVLHPAT